MAKITPEQLPKAFEEIVSKYSDEIVKASEEVIREAGRKTAAALRNSAATKFKGKYPGSWTFTVEGRVNPTAIIYSKVPGLPHLLEYGHATTKGGRVPGKPHIAPVEKTATESLIREMERALMNL